MVAPSQLQKSHELVSPSLPGAQIKETTDLNTKTSVVQTIFNLLANGFHDTHLRSLVCQNGFASTAKKISTTPYHSFSHTISPQVAAISQSITGQCWIYASLNSIRPEFIRRMNLPLEWQFSHNYVVFWDKFEKSLMFLSRMKELKDEPLANAEIQKRLLDPVEEGGKWSQFANIFSKYGLVPSNVMPSTFSTAQSAELNRHLHTKVLEFAHEIRNNRGDMNQMMQEIYTILAIHLGKPPVAFDWTYEDKNGKTHKLSNLTPQSFAISHVKYDPNEYIEMASNPMEEQPYNQLYESGWYINALGGRPHRYVNVEMDSLIQMITQSILKNEPVVFSSDTRDFHSLVSKKEGIFDPDFFDTKAIMEPEVSFNMDRAMRLRMKSLDPWHVMTITGVDISGRRFQVLNSWDTSFGKGGYFSMTFDFFEKYAIRALVKRNSVLPAIQNIWNQSKAVQLEHNQVVL